MSSNTLDEHVKSFVRPSEVYYNTFNPHFFDIRDSSKRVGIDGRIVEKLSPWHKVTIPFSQVPAYIAHYVYQSQQTYINRKILLPRDDTSTMRSNDVHRIHSMFNDIVNEQVKNLYSEKIHHFLMNKQLTEVEKENIQET
jgi:hypothetical protein